MVNVRRGLPGTWHLQGFEEMPIRALCTVDLRERNLLLALESAGKAG